MLRLKLLRLRHGLRQIDIAEALDCTQQAISFYESGARNVPAGDLRKLARLFREREPSTLLDRVNLTVDGRVR